MFGLPEAPVADEVEELEHAQSSNSTSSAPPATRSPSATCTARTVASYGETSGVSIFIASSTTSGWRAVTCAPGPTSTLTTVPGIGAVTDACSVAGPCTWAASSKSGTARGGGDGRFSRQAPLHG